MPEDGIGFKFFEGENGLPLVNDAAHRNASDRLSNEIAHFRAFDHLGTATQAVQEAARHKATLDPPGWDDNVPPGLTGDGDFFLLG